MSKAKFDTLSNLDDTQNYDVTQLIGFVNSIVNSGLSTTATRQTFDSNTDLNTITTGFLMDSWFGSKPVNAPSSFSVYGTFLQIGRTQIAIDNSSSAFSGMAVRSYHQGNAWTAWRTF
jgi:hypothetical protein